MTPITQTRLGEHGNCMPACLASILEVPIEAVPDPWAVEVSGDYWLQAWQRYTAVHHGLLYVEPYERLARAVRPIGFHLINGQGPRGHGHSVVGHAGETIWDPHPSRAGLVRVETFGLLVPLDPEDEQDADTLARRRSEGCPCTACTAGEA